jgi:hypothetical protein
MKQQVPKSLKNVIEGGGNNRNETQPTSPKNIGRKA